MRVTVRSPEAFGCLNPRWYTFSNETGEWKCTGGSSYIMVVHLEPGNVTSFSVLPYGESSSPSSKHYADQLLNYYSRDQLHPDYFYMNDVLAHGESISEQPVCTLSEAVSMIEQLRQQELLQAVYSFIMLQGLSHLAVMYSSTSYLMVCGATTAVLIVIVVMAAIKSGKP